MPTYCPPAFPRRPKIRTPIAELRYELHLLYYRYQINTGLYVMSPGEKAALNIVLGACLGLLLWIVTCHLPAVFHVLGRRLIRLLAAATESKLDGTVISLGQAYKTGGEAVASLADAGSLPNTSSFYEL